MVKTVMCPFVGSGAAPRLRENEPAESRRANWVMLSGDPRGAETRLLPEKQRAARFRYPALNLCRLSSFSNPFGEKKKTKKKTKQKKKNNHAKKKQPAASTALSTDP